MAPSESKRRGSVITELLLLSVLSSATSVPQDNGAKAIEAGHNTHRRPFMRKESNLELQSEQSQGSQRSKGRVPEWIHPDDLECTRENKCDAQCIDIGRKYGQEAVDTVNHVCDHAVFETGNPDDVGAFCQEESDPAARYHCCDCDGGANYYVFRDTQCKGNSPMPLTAPYDGYPVMNPMKFFGTPGDGSSGLVDQCMDVCQKMDQDCSAITVINGDSEFSGMCYFRKGALEYTHDFANCYNSTCQNKKTEIDDALHEAWEAEKAAKENGWISEGHAAAAAKGIPVCGPEWQASVEKTDFPCQLLIPPPPKSQDDVVDNRDCFVKFTKQPSNPPEPTL